eukprot:CCRYP_020859-RA/>CCRYP_020859-RA protein AED:0.24 eAED:0.24 QI:94/1/1/1/0/0/2/365/429
MNHVLVLPPIRPALSLAMGKTTASSQPSPRSGRIMHRDGLTGKSSHLGLAKVHYDIGLIECPKGRLNERSQFGRGREKGRGTTAVPVLQSTPALWFVAMCFWLMAFQACCHGCTVNSKNINVLLVGATGTTGLRAIQGLLDVGYKPHQIQILTRNPSKTKMRLMKKLGFRIVRADLQRPCSLRNIGKGCTGCYIHATGGDTKELDTLEVSSARNLCESLHDDVSVIVYNSAAGAKDHGVKRIQQKHDIEGILAGRKRLTHVTSLRANIFMEELWKVYTRPQILKGRYSLPTNWWRKIYLTSVRDMGRLAGTIIARDSQDKVNTQRIRILNVASEHMSGPQIASAFSKAQGSRCQHVNNRELTKLAKEGFPELYEQIRFLQTSREKTDISAVKKEFPGMLTPFVEFLRETQWNDCERTFGDFSKPEKLEL